MDNKENNGGHKKEPSPNKDTSQLFSVQADAYAKFRPDYPPELFAYILGFVQGRERAWDCATGNGQAAVALSRYFSHVEATDVSEQQLRNAVLQSNIQYTVSPAEQTSFPDNFFDLITIATAYHWLQWDQFYTEAQRVGKPGCVVAAWAYNLLTSDDENVNKIIHRFYYEVMYTYWDKERRHVEAAYSTVDFNFSPLPTMDFYIDRQLTKEDLAGYFSTWSSVQHYIRQNGHSPIPAVAAALAEKWPDDTVKNFRFPLFLKIGQVVK